MRLEGQGKRGFLCPMQHGKVVIVGASGYSGEELVRLLLGIRVWNSSR